ncbi:hypothetical protein ACPPVO_32815 [Dactylosporangium sp. McL0621]|uniref:hypothetical protein n=1 Tax=Dactylosporangium sp. McL0621 TaxID=3415678 RepID=UPI003CECD6D7
MGSEQLLAVDDAGLRQLVAEPYDATLLLIPAIFAVLLGAGRVWRLREAAADSRLEKVVREPGAWPALGPEALLIAVVAVLGIIYWEPVLGRLVLAVCGPDTCRPLPMVLIGWAAIAVPMFALVAISTLARPGWIAMWWIYGSSAVLAFTCSVLIAAADLDNSPRQPTFFAAHPGSFATLTGSGLVLAALPLAVPFARAARGRTRLLVLAGAELAVLPLAIWLGS